MRGWTQARHSPGGGAGPEGDDLDSLSERILEAEHRTYVKAVQLFAQGRLEIEGRRVRILPPAPGKEGDCVIKVRTALLSVYDKEGLGGLCPRAC